jgi:hypothetical protein
MKAKEVIITGRNRSRAPCVAAWSEREAEQKDAKKRANNADGHREQH